MAEIRVTRDLFLWCIAVVYLFAFTSLFVQIPGLYGDNGILPAKLVLEQDAESFSDLVGGQPTLLRLLPCIGFDVQTGMDFLCLGGALLAFVAIVSRDQRNCVVFAVLWMFYLSLFQVGQTFLWFQWDVLLLEVGFLTILVAPLNFFGLHDTAWYHAHDNINFFLIRWLLFRLSFASGLVKLLSGSDAWWSLTALKYHYETQFLPTPVAWYFHQMPEWLHKLSAVCVLVTQIVGALFMLSPVRHQRILAFYAQVLLLSLMTLTGNYGYFTLLTLTLCLSLVDDEWLNSWTRHSFKAQPAASVDSLESRNAKLVAFILSYSAIVFCLVKFFGLGLATDPVGVHTDIKFSSADLGTAVYLLVPLTAGLAAYGLLTETISSAVRSFYNKKFNPSKRLTELIGCIIFGLVAVAIFALSIVSHTSLENNIQSSLPESLRDVHSWTSKHYQLTSPYLFFTRSVDESGGRSEVVVEGSNDLESGWTEYKFRFKPDSVSDRLPIVSPHQPRLDCQMWLAARTNYQQNYWLLNLVYRLLNNQKEVLDLIDDNPFSDEPPRFIRASLYVYHLTDSSKASEFYSDKNWWTRQRVGEYLPVVSLEEQSFIEYLQQANIYQQEVGVSDGWPSVLRSVLSYLRSVLGQDNGSCACLVLVVMGFLLTLFDPSISLFHTPPVADGAAMYDLCAK